jgi:hypothetical protein
VMLEDEALESRYIIRQCVDIEHRSIIPAASERCAGLAYIYRLSCSSDVGDQLTNITRTRSPLRRARRLNTIRILGRRRRALRSSPVDPLE